MTDLDELLDTAYEVARAAGEVAVAWQGRAGLVIEEKSGPGDLVSQADREAELAARAVLARRRPADAVTGEEAGSSAGTSDVRWLVDPIDGTTNYVYGRDDWAVSVAAVDDRDGRVLAGVVSQPPAGRATGARLGGGTFSDGRPVRVSDPSFLQHLMIDVGLGRGEARARSGRLLGALVPAVRDVRRGGSAALALESVATGRADASWGPGLQPWDGAAGLLLVSEAGGLVGDLTCLAGGAFPASGDVLAAGPQVFETLQLLLRSVYAAG